MKDFEIVKSTRNGQVIFFPTYEYPELAKLADGEVLNAHIEEVPDIRRRSNEQLNLYWASCQTVADNTEDENWNTKTKADEQIKIALKHYEYYIYYKDETGKTQLHVKTKSISFKELAHLEACAFFDEAFVLLSAKIGLEVEEFLVFVKSQMGRIRRSEL